MASIGSGLSWLVIIAGFLLSMWVTWSIWVVWAGIALFGCVVFFQLVNLPVEFNASSRAKDELVAQAIVPHYEMDGVNKVLNAAAWTYVAATLQSVLTLLYFIIRFTGHGDE